MSTALPEAVVRPRRSGGWVWLIPLLALAGAGWLAARAWQEQGTSIVIQFADGHGLAPGDELRHRGIAIGIVEQVQLATGREGVDISVRLRPDASSLAGAGSRFWVVRPRFGLEGVGGLETVVGPRYMQVLPGQGPPRRRFVGLERAPVVESIGPADLEIVLESKSRGGLSAGAAVEYRQVRVGTVLSVGLASDGGSVESRLHIEKAFVHLIRPETCFWSTGGLEARMALNGVSVRFESLQALLVGGVALSTPPGAGEVVLNGHRFDLAPAPEEEWLEWQPGVALGNSYLPPGAAMPRPLRAQLSWKEDRFLLMDEDHSYSGWVLPTDRGLLGPLELLRPQGEFEPDSVQLVLAGEAVELPVGEDSQVVGLVEHGALAFFPLEVPGAQLWPSMRMRHPTEVEDCLIVADPTAEPRPLSASRLTVGEGADRWTLDEALSYSPELHGACVLARSDGRLVGVLLVDEDEGCSIALVPTR